MPSRQHDPEKVMIRSSCGHSPGCAYRSEWSDLSEWSEKRDYGPASGRKKNSRIHGDKS